MRLASACMLMSLVLGLACSSGQRVYPRSLRVERDFDLDAWQQAEVRGFTVFSNAPERETRRLIERLSLFIDLVKRVMGPAYFQEGPSRRLFLFRTRSQFVAFGSQLAVAHAGPVANGVIAGLSMDLGRQKMPALLHELVHLALFEEATLDYPLWYHEGMAQVLSTAVFRENMATLFVAPAGRIEWLAHAEAMPLETIFGANSVWDLEDEEEVDRFYVDSWALVRFLHGGLGKGSPDHHRELLRFLQELEGDRGWEQAYERSFEMPLADLDEQYRSFRADVVSGASYVLHVVLPEELPEIRFQPLSRSSATAELADYAGTIGALGLATAFLDDALQRDPGNADLLAKRAVALAGLGRVARAQADLASIPASSSGSPVVLEARGRVALARYEALPPEDEPTQGARLLEEARSELRAALAGDPTRASAWAALAEACSLDPEIEPQEGMAALERAEQLLPANASLKLTRARLLIRLGKKGDARRILQELLNETHGPEVTESARALLEELERQALAPRPLGRGGAALG